MKKWKTLLLAVLCLFAAMAALAACGNTAIDAEETEETVMPVQTPCPTPTPEPTPEPEDGALVVVQEVIPTIYVDLHYATTNNFTGQIIYDFSDARLRYGTVKKLARVQQTLLEQGYSLKIWDAYRPVSAQFRLWEVCPNSTYVANPNTGYSSHSRGNTLDLTLVRADGTEIPMPSVHDEFSALADRDYSDVSAEARENAAILEAAMRAEGFIGYSAEWWHYSDSTAYDVITNE